MVEVILGKLKETCFNGKQTSQHIGRVLENEQYVGQRRDSELRVEEGKWGNRLLGTNKTLGDSPCSMLQQSWNTFTDSLMSLPLCNYRSVVPIPSFTVTLDPGSQLNTPLNSHNISGPSDFKGPMDVHLQTNDVNIQYPALFFAKDFGNFGGCRTSCSVDELTSGPAVDILYQTSRRLCITPNKQT